MGEDPFQYSQTLTEDVHYLERRDGGKTFIPRNRECVTKRKLL